MIWIQTEFSHLIQHFKCFQGFTGFLYLSDCILLMQLHHLWSNCKMLWATCPEFECIKKNSNLEWNLILVSWAFFYTHNTVEKKAIEENFFPSSTIAIWHGCIYIALFSKRKRKSATHCIEVFCTLKNTSIYLAKWIIFGPCMRKTGCFNLYIVYCTL